jgi:malonyl-CoA/methylmalonyl-CoA synthetase
MSSQTDAVLADFDTETLGLNHPTDQDSGDRIRWVPKHQGPNVLPNFFLFSRLLRWSYKRHLMAVEDITYGYTASYAQLLTDVLNLRNVLRKTLPPPVVRRIDNDEEVFINLLGPGGYEFVVGFFALMALGAVIVPICE